MIFDKIKDIIIEQLQVEESDVAMDTNLMKDLSAASSPQNNSPLPQGRR